jgi:hypothetical protein
MQTSIGRPTATLFLCLSLSACGAPRLSRDGLGGATPDAGGGPGSAGPVPTFTLPDASGFDAAAAIRPDAACGFQRHQLNRLTPQLMLVLDRSGSMAMGLDFGSPTTRWEEATAAIQDVLERTRGTVSWGLKNFPTINGCDVLGLVEVPISDDSKPVADAIAAGFPAQSGAGTPTSAAVAAAAGYLKTLATPNPKYMVLATDGLPTCPQEDHALAVQNTLAELAAANTAGHPTFVIGIATAGTDADRVLAEMAVAGGRPRPAAPAYYPVEDRQDLVTALGQITRAVETCSFPLDRQAPSPEDVAVNVDGMRILRDTTHMNGWDYGPGNRVVNLYGAACEKVKSGSVLSLEIIFGCPQQPIP